MAGVYGDVNPITVGPDGLSDRHKDGPGTAIEHAKRRSAERGFPRPFGPLLMKLCPSEPGVSTTAILQRLDIRPGVGPPGVVVRVKHERTVVGRVVLLAHAGRRVVGIACSQRVADVAARQGKAKVAYGLPAVAAHLTAIGDLDVGSREANPGPRRFPWAAERGIMPQ